MTQPNTTPEDLDGLLEKLNGTNDAVELETILYQSLFVPPEAFYPHNPTLAMRELESDVKRLKWAVVILLRFLLDSGKDKRVIARAVRRSQQ